MRKGLQGKYSRGEVRDGLGVLGVFKDGLGVCGGSLGVICGCGDLQKWSGVLWDL